MAEIETIYDEGSKDLLTELIRTRFKLRYNNSLLGFVWVLMKPFLSFVILYLVFSSFKIQAETGRAYAANLLLGLIIFTFFNEGVVFGMNSLLDIAHIILKINFPRQLAVTSSIAMALVNFSINLVIVLVISFAIGFVPNFLGLMYFLAIMVLSASLVYGVSLFLSIIMVKVRDLTNIMELFFQLLFYGSAVFYSFDSQSGVMSTLLHLNPVAILIDAARKALVLGEFRHLEIFAGLVIISLLMNIIGTYFFSKNIRKIAEFF